jgi:DNA/RNA endonuclease YhcR with UshA esterase domain
VNERDAASVCGRRKSRVNPKEDFTILIWGSARSKFGAPETKYKDAKVCVTGKITSYRGKPEIIATEPSQIVQEK